MSKNSKSQKRNKKNRRRAILIAFLLMLVVGVVLGTGTYAWFTANKTVTVDDITVNVATSNGLQISADAITFKTLLSNEDLTGAHNTYTNAKNQIPSNTAQMVPVSTVGTFDNAGLLNMYRGEIVGNESTGANILTTSKSTEANGTTGDFIAFDIFLQVTQASAVYLTSNSGVETSMATSNGIENAARIAFVFQGTRETGTAASTIQNLVTNAASPTDTTAGNQTVKIWELNNDVHTAAAVTNAATVYNINTTQTGGSQIPYYGVKAAIAESNNVAVASTNSTYFSSVASPLLFLSTPASGIPSSAYAQVFNLQAGISKIRVYMWVEGQDVDCENNASGGGLTYNLQFSTLERA